MIRKANIGCAAGLLSLMIVGMPSAYGHCGNCGHHSPAKDIVDTAVGAGSFNTLVTAIKAAGLVDTLKSPGPFTVLAPTDEAFAKLPQSTLSKLLAEPDRLGAILKYHVVPGRLKAADVVKMSTATTALGQALTIDVSSEIRINDAKIINANIETSNGMIHVIDTVLMPSNDIVETARSAGSFKTLLAALDAAGLTDALRGPGPLTVFAPTDEAFAKLPAGTVESLLNDVPTLKSILLYHVVLGKVQASDVVNLSKAKTLQGEAVRIDTSSGVQINSARVVKADLFAQNGVIHVIDEVLLPDSNKQSNAAMKVQKLIELAISKGAPMYNDGHHSACTAIYEVAAMGLMASADGTIGMQDRKTLEDALRTVSRTHNASRNAWTMRHALDQVYASVFQANN